MAKINFKDFTIKIKELYEQNEFQINFDDNGISISASAKLKEWIENELKLEESKVNDEVRYKIHIFSQALLKSLNKEEFKPNLKKELIKETNKQIFDIVKKHFQDKALEEKFIYQNTIKHNILQEVDWEINTKLHDKKFPDKKLNFKTAILKLDFHKNNLDPEERREKSIVFEMQKKDIEKLIEELTKLSDFL